MRYLLRKLLKVHNILALMAAFIAICFLPKLMSNLLGCLGDPAYAMPYQRNAAELAMCIIPTITYYVFVCWANGQLLRKRIDNVTPPGFKAAYEMRWDDQYFAISSDRSSIVIVDLDRDFAVCRPRAFLHSYIIESSNFQSDLILRFNSLEFPVMKFKIGDKRVHEVAAKLNYAGWGTG